MKDSESNGSERMTLKKEQVQPLGRRQCVALGTRAHDVA